ncbi:hypothetical protein CORC01_01451 [Colletotrichum orchidophilum]|uniref:Uncharacterized protein n=1 Tax=Colletotrichum orchidophilum TaxID=1209926 RepID=A0A1G4BP24_9PEZI|nr:uncharacterized protein CORC01_01451 [Colletotrichum orchidophilum]OHF03067.1 hypothetical protein CORC01_01451 [Colletotrichum orchidophilum]
MALELFIPPCIRSPASRLHLPHIERPLRVQIEGPREYIQKLFPSVEWETTLRDRKFPQAAGSALAALTFRHIYGMRVRSDVPGDMVVRDEYMRWIERDKINVDDIDYYGVTFDHLVPVDDVDPEVLQINIIATDDDDGKSAN